MIKKLTRKEERTKRHIRSIKKLRGTALKPRLCVFKSHKHIYLQVINDQECKTIFGLGTVNKNFKDTKRKVFTTIANAENLGKMAGEECLKREIKKVVFDRNGYKYHGRVKAIAEGARSVGLLF